MAPDLTPPTNNTLPFFHTVLEENVLAGTYSALSSEGSSWKPTSQGLNPCDYFLSVCVKDRILQKTQHKIMEVKIVIQ
jgi:hypothetical protein